MKFIITKEVEAHTLADAIKKERQGVIIDVTRKDEYRKEPMGFTK